MPRGSGPAALFLSGFAILYLLFFLLDRHTPYIANGSDVVKAVKKDYIRKGEAFPPNTEGLKIAIFGDSRVLSGFIPSDFDALARRDRLAVYSFNSGFPAQDEFVSELGDMLRQRNQPDVVLLTREWQSESKNLSFFKLSEDDNQLANAVFPFRLFARNLTHFLAEASRSGGPMAVYRASQQLSTQMLRDRGWFFIRKLSLFPDDRLPLSYSMPSDTPSVVEKKHANFESADFDILNKALAPHHTRCFYVPYYQRLGSLAAPPALDAEFAKQIASHSSCRVIGPNYFLYPPVLFNDPIHLNPEGAKIYTADLEKLVARYLR